MDDDEVFRQPARTGPPTPYLWTDNCKDNRGPPDVIKPILIFLFAAMTALPLSAQCNPADIRDDLSVEERHAIARQVADWPYGVGRAFRAIRGDERLFLFGTFHSAAAGPVPPVVSDEIARAQSLFVEVTSDQTAALQARMQTEPGLIMNLTGPGLNTDLTTDEWQALTDALQPMGLQPEVADHLQPWFAATMMAIPPCEMMQQAGGAQPLDMKVEALAREAGIPVAGLETAQDVLGMFDAMSRGTQIDFLRSSLMSVEMAEDVFMTAARQYREGRIAEVQALSNAIASRQMPPDAVAAMNEAVMEPLLEQRNRNWMKPILDAASQGPTVIAVGALHLGGESGLLRLLEREGFDITRIILDGEVSE